MAKRRKGITTPIKVLMQKDPICVEIPGSRRDALKLMIKHNVSGLPVVMKNTKKLLGLVTRKEIFRNPNIEQLTILKN